MAPADGGDDTGGNGREGGDADALTVRQARHDDEAAVAAFTRDTWPGRDVDDYIPDVYHAWVDADGEGQRTLVADVRDDTDAPAAPGDVAGIVKVQTLTDWEAWASGMRVHPDVRRQGVARRLTDAAFDWARQRGAAVCRNMVFSWNAPSLAASRRFGFEPCTEVRWTEPTPTVADPSPDTDTDARTPSVDATADPDGAWAFWSASTARERLAGLVMDTDASWALSTLTRERLHAAAEEGRLVTVDGGRRGFAERIRTFDRDGDDGSVTYAEYGIGAWAPGDDDAAAAVLAGVARDAAAVGADRTRVMVPEGVAWVSDATVADASISDEPAFVLSARL